MITVVVADDQALVRTGLIRMLEDVEGVKVVGEARDGDEAILKCRQLEPDVVLMDIKMPGLDGAAATQRIIKSSECKVLIITGYADESYAARLMGLGASGFLTKGAEVDEVIRAIRAAKAGQRYMSPEIAQALALKSMESDIEDSPFNMLTEREMQIVQMIIDCNKVAEISDRLCLSPKTVNSYRYRVFGKLEINSDVELTRLAYKWGLVDKEAYA